jgi:uncharacterized protein YjbI with pentapeptide repeats
LKEGKIKNGDFEKLTFENGILDNTNVNYFYLHITENTKQILYDSGTIQNFNISSFPKIIEASIILKHITITKAKNIFNLSFENCELFNGLYKNCSFNDCDFLGNGKSLKLKNAFISNPDSLDDVIIIDSDIYSASRISNCDIYNTTLNSIFVLKHCLLDNIDINSNVNVLHIQSSELLNSTLENENLNLVYMTVRNVNFFNCQKLYFKNCDFENCNFTEINNFDVSNCTFNECDIKFSYEPTIEESSSKFFINNKEVDIDYFVKTP